MKNERSNGKSCQTQPLPQGLPDSKWNPTQLSHYTKREHDAIGGSEQDLTARYWRMRLALNLARKTCRHRAWGRFLKELGVEKTRASKARVIHRTFKDEKALAGLTVEEAYALRQRKTKAGTKVDRAKSKDQRTGLEKLLIHFSDEAEGFLNQPSTVGRRLANSLLPLARRVAAQLALMVDALGQAPASTRK